MGKDATNTLLAEDQVGDQNLRNISGSQLKGEQAGSEFRGEQVDSSQFKEPFKGEDLNARGLAQELNQSSGLELRKPAGGFHGDKWESVYEGEQFKSAARPNQLMENPGVGGFQGDKWKELPGGEQQAPLLNNRMGEGSTRGQGELIPQTILCPHKPGDKGLNQMSGPAHTGFNHELESASIREDHFSRDMNKDVGVKGDIIKNETRESKKEMLSELKSHAGHGDHFAPSDIHHDATTIHDGRHDGLMRDGRTALPDMQDNTMRDATVYDGRTRPVVAEPNPLDALPLKDRVIAGVHAGDPLSGATLKSAKKKAKKDKKLKNKKGESEIATFGKDEHFRNDKELIPHEHLKKEEPLLATEHLSGGAVLEKQERFRDDLPMKDTHFDKEQSKKDKKLAKEKHFTNDAHLNKDVNIVEGNFDRDIHASKDLRRDDAILAKDSGFNKDLNKDFHKDRDFKEASLGKDIHSSPHFEKDLNKAHLKDQDAHLASAQLTREGSGKKANLKDKVHRKKEKLKEKLGLKKDDEVRAGGEANLDHSREAHSAPKGHEIATIKIPGIESGDRAAQEMVNHQAKAKKELNAELKEHAGHSDHIAPSEIMGLGHGMQQMNLHENRAVDTHTSMADQGHRMTDQITKDQVAAKSELNTEVKNLAGGSGFTDQLMPSEISGGSQFQQGSQLERDNQFQKDEKFGQSNFKHGDFEGDRLAGLGATDDFMKKDHILAKKDLNAEIKGLGHSDHIMPSEIPHSSQFQQHKTELHGEKLAGFSGSNDAVTNNNILAKKDVNAEIIEHAGAGSIHPSDLLGDHSHAGQHDKFKSSDFDKDQSFQKDQWKSAEVTEQPHQSMTQMIQEKVASVANAVKEFSKDHQWKSDNAQAGDFHKELQGEKLAGLSGAQDEVTRETIMAKKDLNVEIKQAGHTDFPHMIQEKVASVANTVKETLSNQWRGDNAQAGDFHKELQGEKLAGLSGAKDELTKDTIMAKKDLNAEIKQEAGMGHTDHLMPSELHSKEGFQHGDFQKDQFEKSDFGQKNLGLGKDVMTENILAKKEVNAEIKDHVAGIGHKTDHILPSDISGASPAAGVTVIHDGRSADLKQETDILGSDRLKGEMQYQQARGDAGILPADKFVPNLAADKDLLATPEVTEEHHQSMRQMIQEKVANVANAVKETLSNLH